MAKYIGRLLNLGVGRETVRGAGASPAYHIPKTSFSFDDKIIKARSVGSLGYLADSEEAFVTTKYGQGELEAEIRAKSFGLFLYAMLGSLSTTGPTDSAYTHAFSIANTNTHQSLGFTVYDPNATELYKLVMLDSLEIMAELDQIVRFTAGFMSKQGVGSGLTVPEVVDDYKFTKKHLRFKVADTIGGLSGASAISLKSLSLNIAKNTILDDVLGTAEPEDILNRQMSVEGEISLNYEDETWKTYFKNGTNKAVEIAFINNDEVIGASTSPSFTIQLPKVDFHEWEADNENDEINKQTLSFKASRDVANAQNIIHLCQLINDVSSY